MVLIRTASRNLKSRVSGVCEGRAPLRYHIARVSCRLDGRGCGREPRVAGRGRGKSGGVASRGARFVDVQVPAPSARTRWPGRMLGGTDVRVNLAGTVLLGMLLFLTVYPLVMLLYGSLRSAPPGLPGTLSFSGFIAAYGDPLTYQAWSNSLALAGAVTLLSTAMAIFFAFTATRTDAPLRGAIVPIITLTYLVPAVFLAFAWTMLGNPRAGLI